jgi:carbon-monoxide dehydrogenase small subunit
MKATRSTTQPRRNVQIAFRVNGEETEVSFAPYKTLLEVLREDLALTGTKHGCELGECGACGVLLDGEPVLSCLVLGVECDGREVTTVEGLASDGALHPLQDAFADLGAAQCGYCTPAILVTAKALLDANPHPTRDEIREALAGCLCRCTGYQQIFEAVEDALARAAAAGPVARHLAGGPRDGAAAAHRQGLRLAPPAAGGTKAKP